MENRRSQRSNGGKMWGTMRHREIPKKKKFLQASADCTEPAIYFMCDHHLIPYHKTYIIFSCYLFLKKMGQLQLCKKLREKAYFHRSEYSNLQLAASRRPQPFKGSLIAWHIQIYTACTIICDRSAGWTAERTDALRFAEIGLFGSIDNIYFVIFFYYLPLNTHLAIVRMKNEMVKISRLQIVAKIKKWTKGQNIWY